MSLVSVIIPVYNEERFISDCLQSIISQDYRQNELEVICVDGMSTDNTRRLILDFAERYHYIKLLENPNRIVSHALNAGIKASSGDVIIRIDAHCVYPVNYVSALVEKLAVLKADNVGGVLNTLPACMSATCRAIAIASSNLFGVGNSLHKTGTSQIIQTDTVPFGCFRRDIFDRLGYFDTDLIRNQDDEFNARIIKNGGKIFLIPEVVINYYARDKLLKMSAMYYQYGLFKPLVNLKVGSPATMRQLIPPLFALGIVSGAILGIVFPAILIVYFSVLFIYVMISLAVSFREALKYRSAVLFFLLPLVFLLIHLSYGWGYINGIFKFIIVKKKNVSAEANH
jgi:glycosyltransferase involved in cell wall biosynthesis